MTPPPQEAAAIARPLFTDPITKAEKLFAAAERLLPSLEKGVPLDARLLRTTLEEIFGGSDSEGAWVWKDAYEASEAAAVLFLRKYAAAIRAKSADPARQLSMFSKLASLLPSQTRRSEESQSFQQFSTPLDLGFVAGHAAAITAGDVVLEPSAGTGLLAIHAESRGATLALNELAPTRAALLARLFSSTDVTAFDAETIHDRLDPAIRPSVILMNPPFSASPHIERRMQDAVFRHMSSALARLVEGGRLVTITGANHDPSSPTWRVGYGQLQESAELLFTATIDGRVYARHGTAIDTRLMVFEKTPTPAPDKFPSSHGHAETTSELLDWIKDLPPRAGIAASRPSTQPPARTVSRAAPKPQTPAAPPAAANTEAEPIVYSASTEVAAKAGESSGLYEPYAVQCITIAGARPHPTRLVQSAAMASVRPPIPSYRPCLPPHLLTNGILSDAQVETIIYAGEAHARMLPNRFRVDESFDTLALAREDDAEGVSFRQGFFLGDGTGCGKGRQAAGIILDHWRQGRRRALWISKSDKLLEDAQRDWSALGEEKLLIVPQSRYRPGTPIRLAEGILFTTYATLRGGEREGKASRLTQIIDWLGRSFDGVIVFDEAHAMANAAGENTDRGLKAASQQGQAGLRLQHALPEARVVYISATGATMVQNLAYAQRLGLWGGSEFPFITRADFIASIESGGIAAMEVLARDLKALGLYIARSLSYEGVEVELLEHALTPEQIRIYDSYAGAFEIIHRNLEAALKAANVTGDAGTLNKQAKAAARSAFESNKQRFFNYLITAMKTPSLLRTIEADLDQGHAAIVQLVSTGESLLDRRLADIPTAEWGDLEIDITPREHVLDYLANGFPTQLYERYEDENGKIQSRPVMQDGQPVQCRDAVNRRDRLIEHLAALPPVQSALDQIIHHFGCDQVAEVTGRNRRLVRKTRGESGRVLAVENRPGAANLNETQAFMDDEKRILVFSDAGGTGRSYHADLTAKNRRKRIHYLLEPGWRADAAIQGLGRSNRTNQAQPPLFRPVTTDVRGEKRFISTIARRLDSLGAITRGQRQTGGQGMFRAEDNLESAYARDALRAFYGLIHAGKVDACSLQRFEEATGLSLTAEGGVLRDELPPITTFLNRMLALTINLQNQLFALFEDLLAERIEGAIAAGVYDAGLESLTADSITIAERRVLATHAKGASSTLVTFCRKDRSSPLGLEAICEIAQERGGVFLVNSSSGRAALQVPAPSRTGEDGTIEDRFRLIRPTQRATVSRAELDASHWRRAGEEMFSEAWLRELVTIPDMTLTTFHMVSGLLLPLWKTLPHKNPKIYRLQTDDGERFIGRLIEAEQLPSLCDSFGLGGAPSLTAGDAFEALMTREASLSLPGGFTLKAARVMGARRLELTGFSDLDLDTLKAFGLWSEIIAYRLRLFVPTDRTACLSVLERLFARHSPRA
ncbi:MAG: bifunctional class I SAM-dependent methyltransferase/DEAD/DEAH box helicase [Rhodomicrobium sp.]